MNRLKTKSDKSGANITYRALKLWPRTNTMKKEKEKIYTVPALTKYEPKGTPRYRFLISKSNEMESSGISKLNEG